MSDTITTAVIKSIAPPELEVEHFGAGIFWCSLDQCAYPGVVPIYRSDRNVVVTGVCSSSSMTDVAISVAKPTLIDWYQAAFKNLNVSTNLYAIRVEPAQLNPTPDRPKFSAQLIEFWSGKPGVQRPSTEAFVIAQKLLSAVEKLDRPAILVDDDGVLALDLRISPERQVFIELMPDSQIDASIYDETTNELLDVAAHGTEELVALIEGNS